MNILVTGGCGFIGSHTVRHLVKKYPKYKIFNLDKLTYAGNLENLSEIQSYNNYHFIKGDICDYKLVEQLFKINKFDRVINLAAESHVDKSIISSKDFINTNIIGTVNLLESFKINCNENFENRLFLHISTDEVFGSLGKNGYFSEQSLYNPSSPYSASKAGSDHFVRAYGNTFGIPYIISNCSNNYGPFQFPEKLIPLIINNIINNDSLPIYGDGSQVRDWLFVSEHINAIDLMLHSEKKFESYNIGGFNEIKNIDLVNEICKQMNIKWGKGKAKYEKLIKFIDDRPGHDQRYAIDPNKIIKELKWKSDITIEKGLSITIDWYLNNLKWLNNVISREYLQYYEKQYLK